MPIDVCAGLMPARAVKEVESAASAGSKYARLKGKP